MGPGALETALALYQSPSLAAATRLRPVPDDVFEVIRIAAGESEAIDAAVARSGCPATVVGEASQLYLKHVLFDPDADHYRVLGVGADADEERMREHRRWLLKWLHPDRADEWDAVYAARVQQAWQQLRDPVRRSSYDQSIAESDDWAPVARGATLRPVWTARALAAGEGGAHAPRSGAWLALAVLPVLVIGLGWALWPSGDSSRVAPEAGSDNRSESQGLYVLEPVPLPEPVAQLPEPDAVAVDTSAGASSARHLDPVQRSAAPALAGPPSEPASAPAVARAPEPSAPPPATVAEAEPVASFTAQADANTDIDAPADVDAEPAYDSAVATTQRPIAERIDAAAVEAAMAAFQLAYEQGDIEALMGVFTHDARNRRGGREAIRQDYARLFGSSRQRRLQWHSLAWQQGPGHAVGEGGFVASITPRRGTTNTVRGRVRVEVVQRGQQVRIRELWHEDGAP